MPNVTALSADEIVDAVQSDPAIDEANFDLLKASVGQLAEIIGDRHNELVTFEPLCGITLELWRRLKKAGCTYDAGGKLDEQMRLFVTFDGHFDVLLFAIATTEEEAMLCDEMALNDEMRRLYQSGELTFGKLALGQPSVFLT